MPFSADSGFPLYVFMGVNRVDTVLLVSLRLSHHWAEGLLETAAFDGCPIYIE